MGGESQEVVLWMVRLLFGVKRYDEVFKYLTRLERYTDEIVQMTECV